MDHLVAVSPSSWPELRDLYTRNYPHNVIPYYLLDNYIRWRTLDPTFIDKNVEIMCLNGDWSDGTFYLLQDNDLFFYTLNEDQGRLTQLLTLTSNKRPYMWASYTYKRHLVALDNAVMNMNWRRNATFSETCKFYHKSAVKVINDTIPKNNFVIKPLSVSDVTYAQSQYAYKEDVSLDFFLMLHKFNKNLGIYSNGELLAWCLLHQPNSFTSLQVKPEHRRKGLATLLMRKMAQLLADEGKDSFGIIVDGNEASSKLFLKENYEYIDDVFNILLQPNPK